MVLVFEIVYLTVPLLMVDFVDIVMQRQLFKAVNFFANYFEKESCIY